VAEIPVELTVWDITLPPQRTLDTLGSGYAINRKREWDYREVARLL